MSGIFNMESMFFFTMLVETLLISKLFRDEKKIMSSHNSLQT